MNDDMGSDENISFEPLFSINPRTGALTPIEDLESFNLSFQTKEQSNMLTPVEVAEGSDTFVRSCDLINDRSNERKNYQNPKKESPELTTSTCGNIEDTFDVVANDCKVICCPNAVHMGPELFSFSIHLGGHFAGFHKKKTIIVNLEFGDNDSYFLDSLDSPNLNFLPSKRPRCSSLLHDFLVEGKEPRVTGSIDNFFGVQSIKKSNLIGLNDNLFMIFGPHDLASLKSEFYSHQKISRDQNWDVYLIQKIQRMNSFIRWLKDDHHFEVIIFDTKFGMTLLDFLAFSQSDYVLPIIPPTAEGHSLIRKYSSEGCGFGKAYFSNNFVSWIYRTHWETENSGEHMIKLKYPILVSYFVAAYRVVDEKIIDKDLNAIEEMRAHLSVEKIHLLLPMLHYAPNLLRDLQLTSFEWKEAFEKFPNLVEGEQQKMKSLVEEVELINRELERTIIPLIFETE